MKRGLPSLSVLCSRPQLGNLLQIWLGSPEVPHVLVGNVAGMPSPEF